MHTQFTKTRLAKFPFPTLPDRQHEINRKHGLTKCDIYRICLCLPTLNTKYFIPNTYWDVHSAPPLGAGFFTSVPCNSPPAYNLWRERPRQNQNKFCFARLFVWRRRTTESDICCRFWKRPLGRRNLSLTAEQIFFPRAFPAPPPKRPKQQQRWPVKRRALLSKFPAPFYKNPIPKAGQGQMTQNRPKLSKSRKRFLAPRTFCPNP